MTVIHVHKVSEPLHASVLEDVLHAWNPGCLQHISVGHLFLPLDVQDSLETPQIKCVQLVFLSSEQGSGLTAV
jgi:hypothetical protein